MEMSFNILEMLSYFHYFIHNYYSSNIKDNRISVSVELFRFFLLEIWKTGYSEDQTDSKVLPKEFSVLNKNEYS